MPSALPHRTELERTLGHDFGGVTAYLGRADQLAELGARAVTDGKKIAFASGTPDLATAAHEAAHIVQHRQSGADALAAKKDVSEGIDAAEIEADAAAAAIASGEVGDTPLRLSAIPSAGLHRDEAGTTDGKGEEEGWEVGLPEQPIKIAPRRTVKIFGHDVTLSVGAEVGKKEAIVRGKWGEKKKLGDREWWVKALEPQLDLLGREAATTFLKGGGGLTLYPGVSFKVEGSGPGWAVTRTGVKGRLAAIVVKLEGTVPEFHDKIGRPELKDRIDIKIFGQVEIPVGTLDEKILTQILAEAERMYQIEHALDAKRAQLDKMGRLDKELSRKKSAAMKAGRAAEYHELDKAIQANRDKLWKLTAEIEREAPKVSQEVSKRTGRIATLAGKMKGKAGQAVAKSLGKVAATSVGRAVFKMLAAVNVLAGVVDIAQLAVDLVDLLANIEHLRFAFGGGGPSGEGEGGEGDDPASEGKKDGQGGGVNSDVDSEGSGGQVAGQEGQGGRDPAGGGRGSGTGGHEADGQQPSTGDGTGTSSGDTGGGGGPEGSGGAGGRQPGQPDGSGAGSGQGAGSGTATGRGAGGRGNAEQGQGQGTGGGAGGAPQKLHDQAALVLAMLGGEAVVGPEHRGRLNRVAANLSDQELDLLQEALHLWPAGQGDPEKILAALEAQVAKVRTQARGGKKDEGLHLNAQMVLAVLGGRAAVLSPEHLRRLNEIVPEDLAFSEELESWLLAHQRPGRDPEAVLASVEAAVKQLWRRRLGADGDEGEEGPGGGGGSRAGRRHAGGGSGRERNGRREAKRTSGGQGEGEVYELSAGEAARLVYFDESGRLVAVAGEVTEEMVRQAQPHRLAGGGTATLKKLAVAIPDRPGDPAHPGRRDFVVHVTVRVQRGTGVKDETDTQRFSAEAGPGGGGQVRRVIDEPVDYARLREQIEVSVGDVKAKREGAIVSLGSWQAAVLGAEAAVPGVRAPGSVISVKVKVMPQAPIPPGLVVSDDESKLQEVKSGTPLVLTLGGFPVPR